MIGNSFYPSQIEDEVYSLMEAYETEGLDLYNYGVTDAIADYLGNYAKVEFQLACTEWADETGGVCAVSFVECGHPHLVMFDYKYSN